MSVLVKGMEIPKCCCVCPCFNDEYCYCQATDKELGSILIDRRHSDCPLIEVPEWIPVTERLPDSSDEYVLCCGSKGGMFVGWAAIKTYDGSGKCTGFQNSGKGRSFTHWMPLPKPPKDGEP